MKWPEEYSSELEKPWLKPWAQCGLPLAAKKIPLLGMVEKPAKNMVTLGMFFSCGFCLTVFIDCILWLPLEDHYMQLHHYSWSQKLHHRTCSVTARTSLSMAQGTSRKFKDLPLMKSILNIPHVDPCWCVSVCLSALIVIIIKYNTIWNYMILCNAI